MKAVIRPIRKADGAIVDWPESVKGTELNAELHEAGGHFFARITDDVCRGYLVLHGEAEFCYLGEKRNEVEEVCGNPCEHCVL